MSQLLAPPVQRHAIARATAEALELCGIADLAQTQAGALSTGQRRLVELARCLAGPFRLLLLDAQSAAQRCVWKTSGLLNYSARRGARPVNVPMERLVLESDEPALTY